MASRRNSWRYVDTYESGIAIPPQLECVCGGNCYHHIDNHHNAFGEPYYKNPPGIRREASRELVRLFRSSFYNRFWVTRCAHKAIQPTGLERSKRPKLEAISGFIEETFILQRLDELRDSLSTSAKRIDKFSEDNDRGELDQLLERHHEFAEKQSIELTKVDTIRIIPEEVVTGALLYSVPQVALKRLIEKPEQGIVAPFSWPRYNVLSIARLGQEALSLRAGDEEVFEEAA
ncbi:MAG: hypothetical protein ACREGG_04230 [Candidatus Saccharimonadales bacterium]